MVNVGAGVGEDVLHVHVDDGAAVPLVETMDGTNDEPTFDKVLGKETIFDLLPSGKLKIFFIVGFRKPFLRDFDVFVVNVDFRTSVELK